MRHSHPHREAVIPAPQHVRRTLGSTPAHLTVSPTLSGSGPFFILEGEYWTISYADKLLRLRDSKGLRYLAQLLSHPGKDIGVHDLSGVPPEEPGGGLEQARVAVTKRIHDAIAKIDAHHPGLGYHLSTAVRTGARCVYVPEPTHPIHWTVDSGDPVIPVRKRHLK